MKGRRRGESAVFVLSIAALLYFDPTLAGAEAGAHVASTAGRIPAPADAGDHRLQWTFPRFRVWQYAHNAVVTAGNLYFIIENPPAEYGWSGGNSFDDAVRGALRARTSSGRHRADVASDYLWHTVELYPVIVDSLFVPLVTDDLNVDVAWQMSMINWQVIGLASFSLRVIRAAAGRYRPLALSCPEGDDACREAGLSFPSGHAQMVAAGVAAGCAHHLALPLYGGGAPDIVACGVLGGAAIANGVLRVVADAHWATDVVVGWAIGGSIGFFMPWLLHYGQRASDHVGFLPKGTMILPFASRGGAGLTLSGAI